MPHVLSETSFWAKNRPKSEDLGTVYRENIDYVWRALVHLGVKPADVADVAHDVFLVVRKRLSTFEGRSTLRTWIYGICIRVVSDYRSKAFRRRELSHEQVPDEPISGGQQESSERLQLQARLQALLAEIAPEQRDVFVLYEIEELTMKEVAEAIGCPLQTAYSRLHAARDALKSRLKAEGIRP